MILIISNIANEAAADWIPTFPAGAASLITASDFHVSFKGGVYVNDFHTSLLTLNGHRLKPKEITGVITTISAFSPIEFYYIDPADRSYVCEEVNAFMNYFLSSLPCKMINPPTRKCFSGINLHKIEWIKIARQLKIPVQLFSMSNGKIEYPDRGQKFETISCTCINHQLVESDMPDSIHQYVALLTKALSLPYLKCYFSTTDHRNFQLLDINSLPDISSPIHRDLMVQYINSTSS